MFESILQKRIAAESTILLALAGGDKAGHALRELVNEELTQNGFGRFSAPTFYSFIAGMEDRGLVTHEVKSEVIDGSSVNSRWFHLTGAGTRLQRPPQAPPALAELAFVFPRRCD